MLFCTISSDKVYLDDGKRVVSLDRNGIENILWPTLIKWYRECPYSQIFVLNWPGGFTNLRVGAVSFNLLNELTWSSLDFFTCTKIQLYTHLVQKWFLPTIGLIYLGQKKHVWKYNFIQQTYETIDIPPSSSDDMFTDTVFDPSYWWTLVSNMLTMKVKDENLEVTRNNTSITVPFKDLELAPLKEIHAEYCMDTI